MSRTRSDRLLVILCLFMFVTFPAIADQLEPHEEGPPLTNEDIVRLVMTGTDDKAITELIAERHVDFELCSEMVAELRAAGVGDAVINAMRRRQTAMPRPHLEPLRLPDPESTGTLLVSFSGPPDDADKAEHSVIAAKTLPKGAPVARGVEVGLVDDLALAVICTTAFHVPDHWDTRSPLDGAPRHAVLLFEAGVATANKKGFEILYLDYAEEYRIDVPEGNHALQFIVAGHHLGSGAWRLLAADGADVSIAEGRVTPITLEARSRLHGNYRTGFGLDVAWSVVSVGSPDEPLTGRGP
ncbi:MAG: hypothetical protein O7A63_05840 [Acidobacteria bacterium]|nr:hypothetical protein [Acidobacteriota bacterium]